MTGLPTTEHVLRVLQAHVVNAIDDVAGAKADNFVFGQRLNLWRDLVDFAELRDEDEEFAADFHARVMRRNAARSADLEAGVACIIADLDVDAARARLEAATVAAIPSAKPVEAGDEVAHVMAVIARILPRIRHLPISNWRLEEMKASALVGPGGAPEGRAVVDALCRILGLKFQARPRNTDGRTRIAAEGVIDGVSFSFWEIVDTADPVADPSFRFAPGKRPVITRPDRIESAAARRAHKVAATLQQRTGDTPCWWTIGTDVDAMLRHSDDIAAARADLAAVASHFDLVYDEKPRTDIGPTSFYCFASGTVDDVAVTFWAIRDEPVAVGSEADEQFAEAVESFEEQATWEKELLAAAVDPTPESAAAAERKAAHDAELDAAEAEYFTEVDAQFADCAAGDEQAAAAEAGLGVDL